MPAAEVILDADTVCKDHDFELFSDHQINPTDLGGATYSVAYAMVGSEDVWRDTVAGVAEATTTVITGRAIRRIKVTLAGGAPVTPHVVLLSWRTGIHA